MPPSINVWDNDYPSGGNYWSDYKGFDYFSGPYLNETGSDGIGDMPHVICTNNTIVTCLWLYLTRLMLALGMGYHTKCDINS